MTSFNCLVSEWSWVSQVLLTQLLMLKIQIRSSHLVKCEVLKFCADPRLISRVSFISPLVCLLLFFKESANIIKKNPQLNHIASSIWPAGLLAQILI